MKIALAVKPVIDRDMEHNLRVILQTVRELAGRADIVLFGEAALQGFDALSWDPVQDGDIAVERHSAPIAAIRETARSSRIAVCFGYLEKDGGDFYSSQMFIGKDGDIVCNYRRVSPGWREHFTGPAYKEGADFTAFSYDGTRFVIALCGDLWEDGNAQRIAALRPDVVLWPVFCGYDPKEWNSTVKHEYAAQAALTGAVTVFVDPVSPENTAYPTGCAALFDGGAIRTELTTGEGILIVEV